MSGAAPVTPWAEMLRLAMSWGVVPEAFWRLSLREWRMLTDNPAGPALGRDGFIRMTEIYPDD